MEVGAWKVKAFICYNCWAMPAERRVPHTFLNIPALANEIDQGRQWKPVWRVFTFAKSKLII